MEWTGDATGTATTTQITLSDDMAVNAYFVETGETLVGDYDLHVVVQGGGEVLTDGVLFNDGEYALLIARPAFGWRFDHWEGDLTGTDGITGLEMDAAKVVTAVFVPGLSIVTDVEIIGGAVYFGPEEDWILSDPELTNMGFVSAQNVTITAVPEDGYVFSHWEGDISGSSASISMSMSSHLFIRPVFLPMMPLNVIVVGGGSVEVGQGGPLVTDSYLEYYNPLEAVELALTATAGAGYEFDRWESTLPPSGDNVLTAVMDEPVVCVVYNRKLKYRLDVNLSDPSAASVRIMPEQAEYDAGTWVEVSVYPEAGYQFTEWTGDVTGTQNPVWVQINDDTEITATVEEDQGPYSVYASSSDHGYVTVSPTPGPYSLRTPITVTAYPDAGYFVDHWEGDYPGAHGTSFQFAVIKDTAVHAVFATEVARPIRYLNVYARHGKGIDVTFDPLPEQGGIQKTVDQYANEYFVSYSGMYRYGTPVRLTIGGNPQQYPYQDCQLPADWFFYRSTFLQSVHAGFGKREVIYWVPPDASPATIYGYCTIPATPTSSFHCTLEGEGLLRYGLGDVATPYGYTGGSVSLAGSSFVMFHAVPSPGWQFVETSWSHNGSTTLSTSPTTTVTSPASGTVAVTVHFEPDAVYSLTVTEDGEGTATYSPVKASGYGLGERVLLEATPDVGWRFVYWRNVDTGEIISCQEDYTYAIRGNTNLEAVFEALHALTITVDGRGRVDRSAYKLYYEDGETVTLAPAANPGWVFTGWAEDASGTATPLNLTMDGPKAITAQFEPEFNVQVDINDDGNWTNDDEYEAQLPGEYMRLMDHMDNGVGYGNWIFMRYWQSYLQIDDAQELHLSIPPGISDFTFDADTSQVPSGITLHFLSGSPAIYSLTNGLAGKMNLPYDSDTSGELRDTIYMLAEGSIEQSETFDVTFMCEAEGGVFSDTIKFTLVTGLGDQGYFSAAYDYMAENESKAFTSIESMRKDEPGGNPAGIDEDYRVLLFSNNDTQLKAIDALHHDGGQFRNIQGATAANSNCDVIINGVWFDNVNFPTTVSEVAFGFLVSNKKLSRLSSRFYQWYENSEGFIRQLSSSEDIEIGLVDTQIPPFSIFASGSEEPIGIETIPHFIDDPQAWETNNYTSNYTTAIRGFQIPNFPRNAGPTGFLGSVATQTTPARKLIVTAMTNTTSLAWYLWNGGSFGQDGLFALKFVESGGVANELLCVDGGGSVAMAYKQSGSYHDFVVGPRHIWRIAQLPRVREGYCNNYIGFVLPD